MVVDILKRSWRVVKIIYIYIYNYCIDNFGKSCVNIAPTFLKVLNIIMEQENYHMLTQWFSWRQPSLNSATVHMVSKRHFIFSVPCGVHNNYGRTT